LTFSPQTGSFLFVALSADGCAQADDTALGDAKNAQLQEWGKLEGTLKLDDQPAINEKINIQEPTRVIGRGNVPRVHFLHRASTATEGKFKVDHLPPGEYRVARMIEEPVGDRTFRVKLSLEQPVTIEAGKTATVALEGAK